MPLAFTETYHNTSFLEMLTNQGSDSPVRPEHVAIGQSLLKRLRGKNHSKVHYVQRSYGVGNGRVAPIGRYWPNNKGFVCNQNMMGSMRRIVAAGRYTEVDLENAHIRILVHEYDVPVLAEYTSKREDILDAVRHATGVPRSAAKELFIRLAYGGAFTPGRPITTWGRPSSFPPSFMRSRTPSSR